MRKPKGCLICQEELIYLEAMEPMECSFCHEIFRSNAKCKHHHYICDACHSQKGIEVILEACMEDTSKNPIDITNRIMQNPYIYMHGPEHHILVGAALLTAYKHCGGELDLEAALAEMKARGKQVPGGVCGLFGCCGAAVSTGIYYSIVTKCNPLKEKEWQRANLMTAASLKAIAQHGGPRCCKRDSFLAIQEAVAYTADTLNIYMELPQETICSFFIENKECIQEKCPFHPRNHKK